MIQQSEQQTQKKYKIPKRTIFWYLFGALVTIFVMFEFLYTYKLPAPAKNSIGDQKTAAFATYEDIPTRIVDAIIAVEDKRFRIHPGLDFLSIMRAAYQTIMKNNLQGASTIDQQTIKLLDQAFSRSRTRKLYEMRMAINLQFHYSKKDILLTYINSIPFSHGIKGWSSACSIYFQKSCAYLSDAELSYLFAVAQLGIIPYKETNQKIIYTKARILCDVLHNVTNKSGSNRTTEDDCAVLHTQQT